jgi:hypothetical protein
MKTDFDIARKYRSLPTVFRTEFNNFASISANQAWSLFFTAGRSDAALGPNQELGQLFNNILIGVVCAFALGAYLFYSF